MIVGDYLSSVGCPAPQLCDITSAELFIDMNIECANKNNLFFGGNAPYFFSLELNFLSICIVYLRSFSDGKDHKLNQVHRLICVLSMICTLSLQWLAHWSCHS